jgi:hypothetical protein
MRRLVIALCTSALIGLLTAASSLAQSPPGGQMPMPGQSGGQPGPMMSGMMSPGAMCPMMGGAGMMGTGMMPMMPGGQDPKATGRMLQMRADAMRAMADVLMKYGKAMEDGK